MAFLAHHLIHLYHNFAIHRRRTADTSTRNRCNGATGGHDRPTEQRRWKCNFQVRCHRTPLSERDVVPQRLCRPTRRQGWVRGQSGITQRNHLPPEDIKRIGSRHRSLQVCRQQLRRQCYVGICRFGARYYSRFSSGRRTSEKKKISWWNRAGELFTV